MASANGLYYYTVSCPSSQEWPQTQKCHALNILFQILDSFGFMVWTKNTMVLFIQMEYQPKYKSFIQSPNCKNNLKQTNKKNTLSNANGFNISNVLMHLIALCKAVWRAFVFDRCYTNEKNLSFVSVQSIFISLLIETCTGNFSQVPLPYTVYLFFGYSIYHILYFNALTVNAPTSDFYTLALCNAIPASPLLFNIHISLSM